MKVCIIGTGMLGLAVAKRMIAKDIEITAYNRTKSKAAELVDLGALVMDTPSNAARGCDLVITCVTDIFALENVCFGSESLAELANECPTVCDMSTIRADESRNITEKLASSSVTMLGTPVMGGPDAAALGNLVMMVSGSEEVFSKYQNVLSTIAHEIFYMGKPGNAHAVKLAMNLQIAMLALSISEGILLADKSGLDPKKFLQVLNSTYFGTGMSKKKAYAMIKGEVNPTFLLRNLKKDLVALSDSASNLGIQLPMGSNALKVYKQAVDAGYGDLDYTGIIEYLRE